MIACVQLDIKTVELCEHFAQRRLLDSAGLYKMRGESRTSKILDDIVSGAKAEWAVYEALKDLGLEPSIPDMRIHKKRSKSFGPDILLASGVGLHIKAQTLESSKRYGYSWLFQKEDKLFADPSDDVRLVFCSVDGNTVTIMGATTPIKILEANILKAPKVPKYAYSKHALYWDDVLAAGDITRPFAPRWKPS